MSNENQKITGYNNDKGFSYIKNRLKKYNLLMSKFISDNLNIFQKLYICFDFVLCIFIYGSGINDYFQYNFYKRKYNDRKNFIVGRKWHRIIKTCNHQIKQEVFDNKVIFNQKFNKFLGRDYLDIDNCTEEQFINFIQKHPKFIVKIKCGSGGNGIRVIDIKDYNATKLYQQLKIEHVLVEQLIQQHEAFSSFNPTSVNTLRLVTILTKDGVNLMNVVFRMGNGEVSTDNFHHYGLACLVDEKNGVVISRAVDKNNMTYYFHPYTNKQIIGFKIPCWEKIVETVKEAAVICPDVKYVGWDVVLDNDDNIVIIEGNCASDPDITQIPDQIGKWPKYKEILKKL